MVNSNKYQGGTIVLGIGKLLSWTLQKLLNRCINLQNEPHHSCRPQNVKKFFEILFHLLSSPFILSYPDFTKPFILDTDASKDGIGGVLSHWTRMGECMWLHMVVHLLTKPEQNYCVTRKELLAVVTFVTQFHTYLPGHTFTLFTDHGLALTWLYNMNEPEGQVARWLEKLQTYNFEIVHRKG